MLAKYYVTEIIYKVQSLFKDIERRKKFKELYEKDFRVKYENCEYSKTNFSKWNKKPGPQRKYIPVDDYVPIISDGDIEERMKTTKTSMCQGG